MEIRIDFHTLERAAERGTDESEIIDVINTGFAVSAKYGRIGKGKIFNFLDGGRILTLSKKGWRLYTSLKRM